MYELWPNEYLAIHLRIPLPNNLISPLGVAGLGKLGTKRQAQEVGEVTFCCFRGFRRERMLYRNGLGF